MGRMLGIGALVRAGCALVLGLVPAARADDLRPVPGLRAGAIELGLAASLTSVGGARNGDLAVLGGTFVSMGPGLAGLEAEVSFVHVSALDVLGVRGSLSWQPALEGTAARPFLGVGGGVRQEWLGSFSQARYPVGVTLGVRVLAGERVGIRSEYRYLRVLNDPVANFSEHDVRTAVTLLLRNHPK